MAQTAGNPIAELILVFPRLNAKQCAAYLVYHPERRQLMPKVTLLNWKRLQGICRYSVVRMRDYIYFMGGYQPAKNKYSKQVLRYELTTGTWYYCNKMRTPRADFHAFSFDGKIYCAGGRTTGGFLTDLMESFEPITNVWFQENKLPAPCAEFACLCLEQLSAVLLVGGVARSPNGSFHCFNQIWRFGLLKSSNPYLEFEYLWQPLPSGASVPTSMGLRGHQLVLDSAFNRVYLVGGSPTTGKDGSMPKSKLPGLYYFSVEDLKAFLENLDRGQDQAAASQPGGEVGGQKTLPWTWRHLDQCSRSYAAASLIHNKLFLIGGTPVAGNAEVHDIAGDAPAGVAEEPASEPKPAAKSKSTATQQQPGTATEVGYYDKRRKNYHSLYSLENAGLDTNELLSITVRLEKSNRDLKQDRLDWLLHWPLW